MADLSLAMPWGAITTISLEKNWSGLESDFGKLVRANDSEP
jgi:hypothetical protein